MLFGLTSDVSQYSASTKPTMNRELCQLNKTLFGVCTLVQHTTGIGAIAGDSQIWPFLSPKLLNRSTQNFALLIASARSRAVPKIVPIGSTGAPNTYAKYNVFVCLFSAFAHRQNGESHKGQSCIQLRVSRAGRALLGPRWLPKSGRGQNTENHQILPPKGNSQLNENFE